MFARAYFPGRTGQLLVTLPVDGLITALAFLAHDRVVAATADGAVWLWPLDAIFHGPAPREVLAETEVATGYRVDDATLELVPSLR